MSHYDNDYSARDRAYFDRVKARRLRLLGDVKVLRASITNEFSNETPSRFDASLEDFENWLTVKTQ